MLHSFTRVPKADMLQQQVLQVGELKLNPLVIIQLSLCLLNAVLSVRDMPCARRAHMT